MASFWGMNSRFNNYAIEPIDYGHYNDGFYEQKPFHICKASLKLRLRILSQDKTVIDNFIENIQILRIIFHRANKLVEHSTFSE